MVEAPGFDVIDILIQSHGGLFYKAKKQNSDEMNIVASIKYPVSREILSMIQNEVAKISRLEGEYRLKIKDLLIVDNEPIIVYEHYNGILLVQIMKRNEYKLEEKLKIAIALVNCIKQFDLEDLQYLAIEPLNFIIKEDFSEAKFINLQLCYWLQQMLKGGNVFPPSLTPYTSPEVAGRLKVNKDVRSIIYSIGVILYELFTETKFIEKINELEIIHSHLAKSHEQAYLKNSTIPMILSEILDVCLQKSPNDRYDSIHGIQQDLAECLAQLEFYGKIRPFQLKKVAPKTTQIVKGNLRSKETQYVIDLINKNDDQAQFIWVNGEPGVGKTYLIDNVLNNTHSVLKLSVENKEMFVWKKIVDHLLQKILLEEEELLTQWRNELLNIEKINSLLWLSPKLSIIVGEMPTGNFNTYFYDTLTSFLNLFMKKGEPLIIWLDNLEQIDKDSKHYLSYLTLQQNLKHFVVIGSGNFEDEFFLKGSAILLKNLQQDELEEYISPVLEETGDLKEEILRYFYKVTKGNLKEIMTALNRWVSEGILFFSNYRKRWEWKEEKIISLLDLTEKEKDGESFQSPINIALSKAAVLQHPFTIQQLINLTAQSKSEVENILNEAISKKFIYYNRQMKTYEFYQNEIKQHFYLQLKEDERDMLYHKASQLYGTTGEELYWKLYHVNQVPALFNNKELILWNLQAAKEKKEKNNFENASFYIKNALSYIGDDSWDEEYSLVFNVLYEKASILHSMNRFLESEKIYKDLLRRAKWKDQKVSIYLSLLQLEEVNGGYEQALHLGNQIFELIDYKVNGITKPGHFSSRKRAVYRKIKKLHPSDLSPAPIQSDKRIYVMFQALYSLATISYRHGHKDWMQWVIILLEETFKVGVAPQSAFGLTGYSIILHTEYGNMQLALEWGHYALELVEDYPELYIPVKALLLLRFTSKDLVDRDFLFLTREIDGERLMHNNWWNRHYLLLNYRLLFQQGYPLPALYQYLKEGTTEWEDDGRDPFFKQKIILEDFLFLLMGKEDDYKQLQMNLKNFLAANEPEVHFYLFEQCYVMGYLIHYLHGNYQQAFKEVNEIIDQYYLQKTKISNISFHLYFYFLIGYEVIRFVDKKEKKKIIKKMRIYKGKLATISLRNLSIRHRYLAAYAIYLSILNKKNQVVPYCEEAIEIANESGFIQDVAILSEGYAKWNAYNHKKNKAKFYMNEAYHAYREWGAAIKVKEIEREFPTLITNLNISDMERTDYHSIFLSTQALSQEIELPQLLDKLLNIMLQNAGGQYGALLMEEDGIWNIKAYGHFQSIQTKTIELASANNIVPEAIIQYVIRTKEELFLRNVQKSIFYKNEYVSEHNLKSVLCLPILHQNKLLCVLYMENNLTKDTFTEKQLSILKLLSSQCAISISNAKLFTDLQQLKGNLERQIEERTKSLHKSIEATTEALTEMTIYAERNRIAQEIHDIVGHTLTSTILQIEAGKRLINKDIDSALSRLQKAQDSVRHSLNEIRNSVHMLKEDKYYDLQEAMWELIAEIEKNTGVKIEAQIDSVQNIPQITKKLLYHALQESITNGIKHGGSTYFRFTLRHLGNSIHFEISDNGRGSNDLQLGFGLKVMEERVQQLKGTLTLQSKLNEGYKLSIHLPL